MIRVPIFLLFSGHVGNDLAHQIRCDHKCEGVPAQIIFFTGKDRFSLCILSISKIQSIIVRILGDKLHLDPFLRQISCL